MNQKPSQLRSALSRSQAVTSRARGLGTVCFSTASVIHVSILGAVIPSTEAPPLPSRPLAGRVDRVSAANAVGVGGLNLLRAGGAPTPNPSPPLASLAGGGE